MTGEQRWAASGVVIVLAAVWDAVAVWVIVDAYRHPGDDLTGLYVSMIGALILAFAAGWLFTGLVTVRQVASGRWTWRLVASLCGVASALSAACAAAAWSPDDGLTTGLFAFQAVALIGFAALLWTPSRPVDSAAPTDA